MIISTIYGCTFTLSNVHVRTPCVQPYLITLPINIYTCKISWYLCESYNHVESTHYYERDDTFMMHEINIAPTCRDTELLLVYMQDVCIQTCMYLYMYYTCISITTVIRMRVITFTIYWNLNSLVPLLIVRKRRKRSRMGPKDV